VKFIFEKGFDGDRARTMTQCKEFSRPYLYRTKQGLGCQIKAIHDISLSSNSDDFQVQFKILQVEGFGLGKFRLWFCKI